MDSFMEIENGLDKRLFISPSAIHHLNSVMMKGLELVMSLEIPPPFYMSADVIAGKLVIAAMPVYDYQKLVNGDTFSRLMQELGAEDRIKETFPLMLSMLVFDQIQEIPEGMNEMSTYTVETSRLYGISTNMSDIERLDLLTSKIRN